MGQHWRWITVGALALALITAGWGEATEPQPIVGHAAPDFTTPDVEGRPVRLADFRGNRAVLLNFWATWCVPCRQEMPTMEQAYQKYKDRGLEILAVSIDVGHLPVVAATVAQFLEELNLTFPALLDPEMEVARRYRVFGIPVTFLIDREGIIRAREQGFRDWTAPESRRKLEQLMGLHR
ncbi:MAG TPA: TlpA disulfide reductase family protein [Candidatus Methylomirabilis sp.]|jgi:peroxiredoxin|nr:TlpA disulfide reductase family protein [Candidatus Methylomirabilis sp.]